MTARCFVARHGETEWSLSGKHTGTTDIPLTANGEKRVRATGHALVGPDRLIAPQKLAHIYVSPRKRARKTLSLLGLGCAEDGTKEDEQVTDAKIDVVEELAEWDYGEYEGMKSADIRQLRSSRGLDKDRPWDIFLDGCEGGESPGDITKRCDALISRIRNDYHAPAMEKNKKPTNNDAKEEPGDVLCVAHGHILRAFAMRWVGKDLDSGPRLMLEAGGVGTLSYEHDNVDEPAILLGGAFVVDIADKVKKAKEEGRAEAVVS